ncbi:MAG: hypothetical protein PVJ21_04895 [Anaerolineales bacterium]|jgi:hypothetical protein
MNHDQITGWLLEGDVSVQYQVWRDLLGEEKSELQKRIATEGWGARYLDARKPNGHWGRGFYQVKWISTHYSVLDLKHLNIDPTQPEIRETIAIILREQISEDGGINPSRQIKESDVCINGMFLNYACYFGIDEAELHSIVDFIISEQMPDGGFNCESTRYNPVHSSLHTTISILEGLQEYFANGYNYRRVELDRMAAEAREFILQHRLYLSDRTGEIIDKRFLMLSYPSRWKYDILRALDYFRTAGIDYDSRMQPALDVLHKKRRKDGTWPVQAKHPGKVHFDMEKTGSPSRWNTLRALRVLKQYNK